MCLMTAVHGEPRPANLGHGWTVDDSTFGARLALVRQRMQWNIKEAARECGIPAASWGTWESGAMPRRYTEMCRLIANRTGCDYGWLLDGPRLSGGMQGTSPNDGSAVINRSASSAPVTSPIRQKPSGVPRPGSPKRRPVLIGPGKRSM